MGAPARSDHVGGRNGQWWQRYHLPWPNRSPNAGEDLVRPVLFSGVRSLPVGLEPGPLEVVETPVPSALRSKWPQRATRQFPSPGTQMSVSPKRSPPPPAMPEADVAPHELDDEVARGRLGRGLELPAPSGSAKARATEPKTTVRGSRQAYGPDPRAFARDEASWVRARRGSAGRPRVSSRRRAGSPPRCRQPVQGHPRGSVLLRRQHGVGQHELRGLGPRRRHRGPSPGPALLTVTLPAARSPTTSPAPNSDRSRCQPVCTHREPPSVDGGLTKGHGDRAFTCCSVAFRGPVEWVAGEVGFPGQPRPARARLGGFCKSLGVLNGDAYCVHIK